MIRGITWCKFKVPCITLYNMYKMWQLQGNWIYSIVSLTLLVLLLLKYYPFLSSKREFYKAFDCQYSLPQTTIFMNRVFVWYYQHKLDQIYYCLQTSLSLVLVYNAKWSICEFKCGLIMVWSHYVLRQMSKMS